MRVAFTDLNIQKNFTKILKLFFLSTNFLKNFFSEFYSKKILAIKNC